jgi:hypothetical protein
LNIKQVADTKTFDELMAHLDRRAVEARPELSDAESDADSEPDMSWIKDIKNRAPDVFPSSSRNGTNLATDVPMKEDEETTSISPMPAEPQLAPESEDTHDVNSPPGSFSSLGSSPRPPTPLSPSVASDDSKEPKSPTRGPREFSPAIPSIHIEDQPSAGSPMRLSANELAVSRGASPARVSVDPTSNLNPAPINPTSPQAFTPVQKEDANIFTPKYFELVTQRMEQDRERQRRKEDNSGFLAVSGDLDEEIQQMSNRAKAWTRHDFEHMAREKRDWDLAREAT